MRPISDKEADRINKKLQQALSGNYRGAGNVSRETIDQYVLGLIEDGDVAEDARVSPRRTFIRRNNEPDLTYNKMGSDVYRATSVVIDINSDDDGRKTIRASGKKVEIGAASYGATEAMYEAGDLREEAVANGEVPRSGLSAKVAEMVYRY